MKRFFPILISLLLLTALLTTGCSNTAEVPSVQETADTTYNNLTEAFAEGVTFEQLTDYVTAWADENGINVTSSSDTYLVLTKKGNSELEKTESFTFHAAVEFGSESANEASLSSANAILTALIQAQTGSTVRGIFTLTENGQAIGAEKLNTDYLKCDNFIDISYAKKSALYNSIAASADMSAVKDLYMTSPGYTEAYKIDLKLKEGQSAYKNRGTYPNAIKTIGDLLASCQSSTILFELASFEGGTATDMLPSEVTATIVLHENDVESFTKKFDKSYERIEKAYEDLDDEEETFEYTMTEVDTPDLVVSKEDTENIVSLMYTMINGAYVKNDDGEVKAYSNQGIISVSDGQFQLDLSAKSLENNLMEDIKTDVKTICGLCDIDYKSSHKSELWFNASSTPLVAALSDGMHIDPSGILESKAASIFLDKKENLNLIGWATESKDMASELKVILNYMQTAGTETTEE